MLGVGGVAAGRGETRVGEQQAAFGGLLRRLRTDARLTQEELAEAAQSSPRTISDLERGVAATPQRDTVRRLADALRLSEPVRAQFEAAARGRPAPADERPAGAVVAGNVPLAPSAFQPRDDLIAELRAAGPGVSVVRAVTGMRGVGKTQLAAAYARQCRELGWRLIAWVNAEDTAGLLGGLAVVADRLGIDRSGKTLETIGAEVRNRLEADGDRSLIVFDNVTDLDVVRPYIPALGTPQVVITSTEATVAGAGRPVQVDVFSEDESVSFLAARTGRDDPAGASALAAELGCLPLALAQAAAVIAAQHLTYQGYLDRLRGHRAQKYLPPAKGDPYAHSAAEAIGLSVDTVAASDPGGLCQDLLDLMSLLSAEGVSRQVLYAGEAAGSWTADAEAVDEALARLADASLLTFGGDDTVVAHRMVMRVLRERAVYGDTLPALAAKATGLLDAGTKALGEFGELWQHRTATREYVRQVTALAEHLTPYAEADSAALLSLRVWALEAVLRLGDNLAQGIQLGERLVPDCVRVLGASHPDTLMSRNDLAHGYQAAGRLAEAVTLFEAVLTDGEPVLGVSHPDMLTTRNNLAQAYGEAGRPAEAVPLLEAVVAEREVTLGPSHPDTLQSRNNLAGAYYATGRLAEALLSFEAVAAERERVLGPSHPQTLTTRNNLARMYQADGRLAEAVTLLEAVVADRERVLGPSHPDGLPSRHNLAAAYLDAGRLDEAVPLLEAVLADCERLLAPSHPGTLTTRNSLARAYRDTGRLDAALPLFEQALAGLETAFGPEHPTTVKARRDFDSAREQARRLDPGTA
jgi:tetratricopeptide (TPR) repeat protein/transcriptional regulator with XRE-family HTH domain